jgi:hypothetical protein
MASSRAGGRCRVVPRHASPIGRISRQNHAILCIFFPSVLRMKVSNIKASCHFELMAAPKRLWLFGESHGAQLLNVVFRVT